MTNNKLQIILAFVLGILFCLVLILAAKRPYYMQKVKDVDQEAGRSQKITGYVYSDAMCTAMGCAADNQCCNSCGGYMYIADSKESMDRTYIAKAEGEFYECKGNECEMKCDETFMEGQQYQLTGEIKKGGDALPLDGKYIIPTDIKAVNL